MLPRRSVASFALTAGAVLALTLADSSRTGAFAPSARALDPSRFAELASGVVLVRAFNCSGSANDEGSGFLIGSRVVMTARQVVKRSCELKVSSGGKWLSVASWTGWRTTAKSTGSAEDLVTLLLGSSATGHVFAIRAASPRVGTNLAAIGHRSGNRLSVPQGPVALHFRRQGVAYLAVRLRASGGASGSPLVDNSGRVAGMLQLGHGPKDIVGEDTAGLVAGIDLGAWWASGAKRDLCNAYPPGGIPACSASPPGPVPPPPVSTPPPAPPSSPVGPTPQAGLVEADGTVGSGSGFTAVHVATGEYQVRFPAGTWDGTTTTLPVQVSAASTADVSVGVESANVAADGSAVISVVTFDAASHPVDSAYFFIVLAEPQHLPSVKSIGGLVEASGAVGSGSGFTAARLAAGAYQVHFPAGTWDSTTTTLPAVAAAASDANCVIYADTHQTDGSASIVVTTFDTLGQPTDTTFSFNVAQA
jgi:hypothetical protein